MLTRQELKKLRNQVCKCSLFYSDYENTLGIDRKVVSDFFDGYFEYLIEVAEENGENLNVIGNTYYDRIFKYDNIENLENWYMCFEEDPLPITEIYECAA